MAKVVARKETSKLVIDFTYRGVRCREQTALDDTPRNRKLVQGVVDRLKVAIQKGSFVYAEFFPGSSIAARLSEMRTVSPEQVVETGEVAIGPTFKTFADQWVQEHSIEWRRSHIRSLLSTIEGRLYPHFGEKIISTITKADVLAFRAALAKEPGRGARTGLSAKRINEIMGTLKQILEEAVDRLEFTSPVTNVKRLRVRKTDVQPFSLAEMQTILATVRPDYRDYLQVRFLTGMRTGEVNGLKWKYIDFDSRLILVRETHVLGEDDYTKTDGSQRDIKMSQPVFDALQRQREITFGHSAYVFCNMLGGPLDNTNFTNRIWYPLLRHLAYELRRPYQMRHTAATLWLASGEAPEFVARQLGHTSTEMLFRTYSRYVPNMTRQDGSAMERLLANQFENGPLVRYEPPAEQTRQSSPRAQTVSNAVVTRRSGPNLYVPVNQASAMPVPKPRGVSGARMRPTHPHRDLSTGPSIPADGTDAQPPPMPWLRTALRAEQKQPMRASLSHWH
jgi:integrase